MRDTKELLITIIVFDHTKDNSLSFLSHRLELIKNIKDTFKRKKADITIKNNNNLTPYDIEKNIVFNIIENKRRLKSKFDYTDSNEIQEKFNQAKTTNDLDQIIKYYYIMIKTNDNIVLATTKMCLDGQNSVPKKIKKKIIQHAIDNPYDFFDYEYSSSPIL